MMLKFFIIILIAIQVRAETFNVALPMLPDVNPITNQINSGNYIGSHLYYPLFETDGLNVKSFFLDLNKTFSVDNSFSTFNFCLNEGIKFSDNSNIGVIDLEASLKYFSEMYPQILDIKKIKRINDKCVKLTLNRPNYGLFKRLSGMASTVLKFNELKSNYPVGAGPYKILKKSDDQIELVTTNSITPRFDKIIFKLIKKENEIVKSFHDFNQLPPNSKRDADFNGQKIDVPSLKVYAFVINVDDANTRSSIRFMLNKTDWSNVYNLILAKSDYFLPWLNADYQIKFNLLTKVNKNKNKIPFLVPDFYDSSRVESELKLTGLDSILFVKSIPAKDFAAWAFSGKEYVGLMGFDSSGSISSLETDFSVYFESFYSQKNRIVAKVLKPVKEFVSQSLNPQFNSTQKRSQLLKAEKYLSDNNYLHPIGRVKRVFLYPSNVVINNWYDYFSGIPRIDRIK